MAVLILLSLLVVPVFRDVLTTFGLQLPTLTKFNLWLALWISHGWRSMLIALAAFFLFVACISWLGRFRPQGIGRFFLMPFGRTAAVARLSRFMADLLEAGLTIPDTLKIAGLLTRRNSLRKPVWRLADELELNIRAADQLEAPPKIAAVYHALRSEMPNSTRVRLLREIDDVYSERVRSRLSWARGIAEPAAILLVGFIVLVVVNSLFSPLFNLVEGLSM